MSKDSNKPDDNSNDDLAHLEFDGLSPLEEEAANMHEMFLALTKAGFNEKQALQLIALMIEHDSVDTVHFHFDEQMSDDILDDLTDDEDK
jgi:hypothetical protein